MSNSFEAPALNRIHSHLSTLLLRLRRFVNRSVARMLASLERQVARAIIARGSSLP